MDPGRVGVNQKEPERTGEGCGVKPATRDSSAEESRSLVLPDTCVEEEELPLVTKFPPGKSPFGSVKKQTKNDVSDCMQKKLYCTLFVL